MMHLLPIKKREILDKYSGDFHVTNTFCPASCHQQALKQSHFKSHFCFSHQLKLIHLVDPSISLTRAISCVSNVSRFQLEYVITHGDYSSNSVSRNWEIKG